MSKEKEALEFIEDRINELTKAKETMNEFEKEACDYVLNELNYCLTNLKEILED